jgi:hypothetical protein
MKRRSSRQNRKAALRKTRPKPASETPQTASQVDIDEMVREVYRRLVQARGTEMIEFIDNAGKSNLVRSTDTNREGVRALCE